MNKDPIYNLFKYKMKLKRDKYEYKFIVDNFWKFSRAQGIQSDERENTNNYIDLTDNKISKNVIKKLKKRKKKQKKLNKKNKEK